MSRYFTSIFLLCFSFLGISQDQPLPSPAEDAATSVVYKEPYGLRIGIDLARPLISSLEADYSGFEVVGDFRLSQTIYLAAEFGNEDRTRQEDLYNFTTTGSYLKVGIDYNTYSNWLDEQNLIHIGGRLGYSAFSHTVNNFQFFDTNRYWSPDGFTVGSTEPTEFNNRSKLWIEAVLGIKAELFSNIYLGGSVRMGFYLGKSETLLYPDTFNNLFIPGFNRLTDDARFGLGYNFTLTYFIPFYKRKKVNKKKKVTPPPPPPEREGRQ